MPGKGVGWWVGEGGGGREQSRDDQRGAAREAQRAARGGSSSTVRSRDEAFGGEPAAVCTNAEIRGCTPGNHVVF